MADYNGLKAAELKDLLKERGIPSTGLTRKQQYIEALEAQDAQKSGDEAGNDEDTKAEEDASSAPNTGDDQNGEDATPANDAPSNDAVQQSESHDAPADQTVASAKEDALPAETIAPQAASPAADDQTDSRKRKRRGPTPPISSDSVQKKLRAADEEEVPTLQEDLPKEAPAPVEASAKETIQRTAVSDDVMDVSGQEDVKDEDIEKSAEKSAQDASDERPASTEPMAMDTASDETGPPSQHPPTSALYIRNLLRPLQLPPFRDHLLNLATPPQDPIDDSLIETIHLDTFKSHAFVIFTDPSAAARARAGLHDRIWPDESQRKPLWVDFIPPAQTHDWIATEQDAGKSKRFEVVYSTSPAGETLATLEEVPQATAPGSVSTATPVPGPGMPNAPTGPRNSRPAAPMHPRKPPYSPTALAHFPCTQAQPKLFYQPVSPALVDKRLDELDRETSRDWDGGRQKSLGTALDQLRRYTFEDGDVVVDGGVDFGGFGRDRGAGGGAGHGGGGRRRGGGGGGGGGRRR